MLRFEAIAAGTRCKEPLYSLSINPSAPISRDQYRAAIDRTFSDSAFNWSEHLGGCTIIKCTVAEIAKIAAGIGQLAAIICCLECLAETKNNSL